MVCGFPSRAKIPVVKGPQHNTRNGMAYCPPFDTTGTTSHQRVQGSGAAWLEVDAWQEGSHSKLLFKCITKYIYYTSKQTKYIYVKEKAGRKHGRRPRMYFAHTPKTAITSREIELRPLMVVWERTATLKTSVVGGQTWWNRWWLLVCGCSGHGTTTIIVHRSRRLVVCDEATVGEPCSSHYRQAYFTFTIDWCHDTTRVCHMAHGGNAWIMCE